MAQLHFKQVSCAMYVPKNDLFLQSSALVCQNQAGNAHIHGASPSYLPTSLNRPNQNIPHRWRISFHPEAEICPKNRTCFQLIPNHMDGANQARAWWWGQKPVSRCVCHCPPWNLNAIYCMGCLLANSGSGRVVKRIPHFRIPPYVYNIYIHTIQYNINMCNLQYKQAKMIGHAVNLVGNTLMSIYWSGSCAIYFFILK